MFNRHLRAVDVKNHSGLFYPLVGIQEDESQGWLGTVSQTDLLDEQEDELSGVSDPDATWEG